MQSVNSVSQSHIFGIQFIFFFRPKLLQTPLPMMITVKTRFARRLKKIELTEWRERYEDLMITCISYIHMQYICMRLVPTFVMLLHHVDSWHI